MCVPGMAENVATASNKKVLTQADKDFSSRDAIADTIYAPGNKLKANCLPYEKLKGITQENRKSLCVIGHPGRWRYSACNDHSFEPP